MKPANLSLLALLTPLALAGCVVAPPMAAPLVAYPGQNKTAEAFRQDDTACRQQPGVPPGPQAGTATAPGGQPGQQAVPADLYFQCMTSRGNGVGPSPGVAAPLPTAYVSSGYLGGYGAGGYGPDYWPSAWPGLWADPFWFSYYGARGYGYSWGYPFGWYGGFGGYGLHRGGYYGGYRGGYGGYRGGYGFRGGGGGGYRGGFGGRGGHR